jgi:hypothetical protein
MRGAIETSSMLGIGPGHLNADDSIGVTQLALTTGNLDTIEAVGSVDRTVTVTRRSASAKITDQYAVTCTFSV